MLTRYPATAVPGHAETPKDRQQVLTTTFEPIWYWGIPSLFTPDQVAQIRQICETAELTSASLASDAPAASGAVATELRRHQVSRHDDERLYQLLRPILRQVNTASGWNYDITAMEPLQYSVYQGNEDHFTWHTDTVTRDPTLRSGATGPLAGTVRKISCTIQLSDDREYDGGDFELLSGTHVRHANMEDASLHVQPMPLAPFRELGSVLFFPSFTYHRIRPVRRGTRRSLVCWFRGPKWR